MSLYSSFRSASRSFRAACLVLIAPDSSANCRVSSVSLRATHPALALIELLDRVVVVGVVAAVGLLGVLDGELRVLLDEVGLVALLLAEALVVVEVAECRRRVGDLLAEQVRLLLDLLGALGRLADAQAEVGDRVLRRLERVGISRARLAVDGAGGERELVEALVERRDEELGVALVGRVPVPQRRQLLLALGDGLVELREAVDGGLIGQSATSNCVAHLVRRLVRRKIGLDLLEARLEALALGERLLLRVELVRQLVGRACEQRRVV